MCIRDRTKAVPGGAPKPSDGSREQAQRGTATHDTGQEREQAPGGTAKHENGTAKADGTDDEVEIQLPFPDWDDTKLEDWEAAAAEQRRCPEEERRAETAAAEDRRLAEEAAAEDRKLLTRLAEILQQQKHYSVSYTHLTLPTNREV